MSERTDDFAFRDVCLRAGHSDCLAARVAGRDTTTQRPDIAAVFVAHPIFTHELRGLVVAVRRNLSADSLAVSGINLADSLFVGRPVLAL